MATFQTGTFDEVRPAQYRPTAQVDPTAGNLPATVGAAAGQLVKNLDTINQYKVFKESQPQFDPVKQAFRLYSQYETDPDLGSQKLLGAGNQDKLASLLADRIGTGAGDPVVKEAMGEFERIANAYKSGSTAYDVVHVRAQAKLKQLINQRPGYEAVLRQAAANSLGFDPTGSDVAESINALNKMEALKAAAAKKSQGKSWQEKTNEATAIAAAKQGMNPALLTNDLNEAGAIGAQYLYQKQQLKDKQAILNINASEQVLSDNAVIVGTSAAMDESVLDFVNRVQIGVKQGGLGNPEELISSMTESMMNADAIARAKAGANMSATASMRLDAIRDKNIAQLSAMIRNGSIQSIAESDNEQAKSVALRKILKNKDILSIYSTAGGPGVIYWLGAAEQAAGNKGVQDTLNRTVNKTGGMNKLTSIMDQEGAVGLSDEMSDATGRVAAGQGSEEDKTLAAIQAKQMYTTNGGVVDKNGKPTSDPFGKNVLSNIGLGRSIDVFNDPNVAIKARANSDTMEKVNTIAAGFTNQLKVDIEDQIPKYVRQGLKGEVVVDSNGQRRIRWSLDLNSIPEGGRNIDGQSIPRLDAQKYLNFLNDPYNKTSSPNSIQKSLDKFYRFNHLYQGAPGFPESDATLKSIIDSVIIKPEPKEGSSTPK